MTIVLIAAAAAAGGFLAAWFFFGGRLSSIKAQASELQRQLAEKNVECQRLGDKMMEESTLKVEALTRLEESRKSLEAERKTIEALREEMKDTFNALSAAALKSSSEEFLKLASENLGKVVKDTEGKLSAHKASMDGLLIPLKEALSRYEEYIKEIDIKRVKEYTSLDEQIKLLSSAHLQLQQQTVNLVSALRKPHVRGRWGEVTLRNVVELAGMSAHCDFTEQESAETEAGRLRPDMLIHLPGARTIVVDSKVSMEALLDAFSAKTEEEKKDALQRHGRHTREQVDRLASKKYWEQFPKAPQLAVLFISESALAAALEVNSTLIEDGLAKRVLIATPTSLFALLTAVAHGWRQAELTKNAEEIGRLGKELYERIGTWAAHLSDIGTNMGKTVDAYNRAIGSLESRVLPSLRKFRELGISGPEIPRVEQSDKSPRTPSLYE